jgi:NitT/TauT family transport system substrate-binding protein
MKKILICFGVAVLIIALVSIFFFQKSEPLTHTGPVEKINLGITRTVYSLLIVVAAEEGLFFQNGLDVNLKEYESGRVAVDHLIQGDVDVATAAEFVFANESLDHHDLSIVASIATSGSEEIVARKDKGIAQPADLKGKRIGVSLNTSAEYTLMRFLMFNHIPLNGVELVDLAPSRLGESLSREEVDAIISWEIWAYEARNISRKRI